MAVEAEGETPKSPAVENRYETIPKVASSNSPKWFFFAVALSFFLSFLNALN